MNSKAQIIATIGPSSSVVSVLSHMMKHQMDVARLNMSWGKFAQHAEYIKIIREAEKISRRKILILVDLPGPRIQNNGSHMYDRSALSALTSEDEECISFGIKHDVDYFAESFVGTEKDVRRCKEVIRIRGGGQRVIAKIERAMALKNIEGIIKASDALMVARGDLGNEVPLEQIPFVQQRIIHMANAAGKPVITATEMLLSMVDRPIPSRADVTDVANAILQGSDAVMLSEESAIGKHPVEAVAMMEKIVLEAERHRGKKKTIRPLVSLLHSA